MKKKQKTTTTSTSKEKKKKKKKKKKRRKRKKKRKKNRRKNRILIQTFCVDRYLRPSVKATGNLEKVPSCRKMDAATEGVGTRVGVSGYVTTPAAPPHCGPEQPRIQT